MKKDKVPLYVTPELRRELMLRKWIGNYADVEETLRKELKPVDESVLQKAIKKEG